MNIGLKAWLGGTLGSSILDHPSIIDHRSSIPSGDARTFGTGEAATNFFRGRGPKAQVSTLHEGSTFGYFLDLALLRRLDLHCCIRLHYFRLLSLKSLVRKDRLPTQGFENAIHERLAARNTINLQRFFNHILLFV